MKKVIIFSAPSGSGKTTVVNHLLKKFDFLGFSVSATTRQPRPNETNGKEYYFLEKEEFKSKICSNKFIEYEEVYNGILYGTLQSEIERLWEENKIVIFDVDVKGGIKLKKKFGNQAISVFLRPPSVEILTERLRKRSTEVEHQLLMRINKAHEELKYETQYDILIVNDQLEDTLKKAEEVVLDFKNNS